MLNKIYNIDALSGFKNLPDEYIDCIITSPPYWGLRDYNHKDQLGLEKNFNEYINKLCNIFDESKRTLKKEGSLWVNLGDTYSGNSSYSSKRRDGFEKKEGNRIDYIDPKLSYRKKGREMVDTSTIKNKCLCQIPFRFSIEMTNRGWILRNVIIWHKNNAMPSAVKDRFTVDFEYLFFFVKNEKYYFEQQFEKFLTSYNDIKRQYKKNIKESNYAQSKKSSGGVGFNKKGRNKRTTWTINTKPFRGDHFAVFPEELIITPIKAGCPENGIVCDPFIGSGTTAKVAIELNRKFIGFEINKEYINIAEKRLNNFNSKLYKREEKEEKNENTFLRRKII